MCCWWTCRISAAASTPSSPRCAMCWRLRLDVDCQGIAMDGWQPDAAPGHGWPPGERSWINPSPNAPNLWMARAYAGTVMLEGTTLSEGRGTTRPLELLFGAP